MINRKWTVSALHDEDSQELLIAGVFSGHRFDASSACYTTGNLYRFLRFVEAPTADDAEHLVLDQFEADSEEEDMEEAA
ncbi:hypothetical protein ACH5AU_30705 [Streptomyces albidoflavus]